MIVKDATKLDNPLSISISIGLIIIAKSRIMGGFCEINPYFCTMEKTETYTHPIVLYNQRIKEEGIVVFDDVRGMPTGDEPFISPDYVICIGHRGHIDLMYDDTPDYSEQHTVGVIFPNHCVRGVGQTNDYLATLIIADVSVLSDPMLQIIKQIRYRYEPHPCVKLDKQEYRMIMHVVELMCETVRLNLSDRRALMARQLEFFLRLLSHYRTNKLNETDVDKRISTQFRNNLAQCFRKTPRCEFLCRESLPFA